MIHNVVFIYAKHRSGTHLLRSLLDSSPDIVDCGEVFRLPDTQPHRLTSFQDPRINFHTYIAENYKSSVPSTNNQARVLIDYINYLRRYLNEENRTLLIDIKYPSTQIFNTFWQEPGSAPYLLELAQDLKIPSIHLIRKNVFLQSLSFQLATKDKLFVVDKDSVEEYKKRLLDPQQTITLCKRTQASVKLFFSWLQNNPHSRTLYYEDLCDQQYFSHCLIPALSKFLDLTFPTKPKAKTKKLLSDPSQKVDNLDELLHEMPKNLVQDYMEYLESNSSQHLSREIR